MSPECGNIIIHSTSCGTPISKSSDLISFQPAVSVNLASRTVPYYLNYPNEANFIMPSGIHPPITRARTLRDPAAQDSYTQSSR
jgi:hypothetical protein